MLTSQGEGAHVPFKSKKNRGSQTVELCFLTNLTSSEWAAWSQAATSGLAIVAGACGIVWQVGRQHRFQLRREVEAELKVISELQQFLLFADHYLGSIAGASLTGETYAKYFDEADRAPDYRAVTQVFEETRSSDIPGPLLKLAFKHCASAFNMMTSRTKHGARVVGC